jgi:hypothetical protein
MAQISIISNDDSGTSSRKSRSYEYKVKSTVRSKLEILTNLEVPLIQNIWISEFILVYSARIYIWQGEMFD